MAEGPHGRVCGRDGHVQRHGAGASSGELSSPFGMNTSFIANFQTAPNPFNAANTHRHELRHRVLGRPRLRRRLRRLPHLRHLAAEADARLRHALLRPAGRPVGLRPRPRRSTRTRSCSPSTASWRGRSAAPCRSPRARTRAATPTGPGRACGSSTCRTPPRRGRSRPSTRTADRTRTRCFPPAAAVRCTCSTRATRSARADLRPAGRAGRARGRPRRPPGRRGAVPRPGRRAGGRRAAGRLPGDADGTYKPVSEHGIVAPLDDFLGCHDLSAFPDKGIVGAACGEQAQVWNIDRRTGLPDTGASAVGLRPAERRLLALGDVQLGRQGGQLHRRVVRRRLPAADDQDRRPAGVPRVFDTGNCSSSTRAAARCCRSTATRGRRTTTRARRPASTAPRTSASRCRRAIATCWSTRTIAAARR